MGPFNKAYFAALRQLVITMAPEHAEMILNEIVYARKSREEMERLIKEGKAYDGYARNARFPFKLLSRLTLKVKEMCLRHALGDERLLALPPEVAQLYLTKRGNDVLLGEFECASCGFDIPFLQTPANWNNPDKFAHCPMCGSSLDWWPGSSWEREAWSKANPEKSMSVNVWPNGSVSYNDQLLGRFKGEG